MPPAPVAAAAAVTTPAPSRPVAFCEHEAALRHRSPAPRSSLDRPARLVTPQASCPSLRAPHRSLSRSVSRSRMVSGEEVYEALPHPQTQKEHFYPAERLRIAHQTPVQTHRKQPSTTAREARLPSKLSMDSLRPQTAHSYSSSTFSQPRGTSVPRHADHDVDRQQAIRFLALPDKVKRSHFTREELILLTESSERALGLSRPPSDDSYARLMPFNRNGSARSSLNRSSLSDDVGDKSEKGRSDMESESLHSFDYPRSQRPDLARAYGPKRQDSIDSSYSALPPCVSPIDAARPASRRRSSARNRPIPLAPLPLPPPTLRPAKSFAPSSNETSNSAASPQSQATATAPENEAPTKYYKDSQARMKLREYLASPEKFDEALEFGFSTGRPTDRLPASSQPEFGTAPAVHFDEVLAARGRMDDVVIEDDDEDDQQLQASGTPAGTLSFANQTRHPRLIHHPSLDSGVAVPLSMTPGKVSARSLSPDINGREMTLRMTLTRPDLRTPEEELYNFQGKIRPGVVSEKTDPLALAALTVCDDHTGAHGAFAVSKSPGGLKKVWKSFRGR